MRGLILQAVITTTRCTYKSHSRISAALSEHFSPLAPENNPKSLCFQRIRWRQISSGASNIVYESE